MAKMTITMTSVTSMRKLPNRRMPRSNSVSSGRSFSRSETLPNSVFLPVPMTIALALPLTTWVPIQSALDRLPSGVSVTSTPIDFSAG